MNVADIYKRISELKQQKNAVILSHYYMSPELQLSTASGGVADFVGDSLGLSMEAKQTQASHIVFCGVYFMAETASILNPGKAVYIPDPEAGCSLAASITGRDVKMLRDMYPGVPVMAYINTNAETKAECDICCTSRNALSIARALPGRQIIFVPDRFMGQNLRSRITAETGKELILWEGSCEVHEQFTPGLIGALHRSFPQAEMLLHWEVPEAAVAEAFREGEGVLGSTSDIIRYVGGSRASQFILASECDLGATLKGMYHDKEFITPCMQCPYMKKITLLKLLDVLEKIGEPQAEQYRVRLDADIMQKARKPIERMLEFV